MTTIQPLTSADRDEWLVLWAGYLEFYESALSQEQTELTFQRLLDPGFNLHGAIARDGEGRAIGITHWLTHPATWSRGPYCYLEDLFVDPSIRRSGAGAALIEHVHSWARSRECEKVYWLTQQHNVVARSLYGRVAKDTGFVHYEIAITPSDPARG